VLGSSPSAGIAHATPMNRSIQRLGFAFGGVLLITVLWVRLFPSAPEVESSVPLQAIPAPTAPAPSATASNAGQGTAQPSPGASPATTTGPGVEEGGGLVAGDPNVRTYAVSTFDLQGLPPNAAAGTVLELWVAWEPPIVDAPRYQKLLPEVILEKVIPGLTPEAPATALLQVKTKELADLLYADRFGELSVAALP
jgi:hypothetical protein